MIYGLSRRSQQLITSSLGHLSISSGVSFRHTRSFTSYSSVIPGRQSFYMGDNIVNFYAGQPPLNRLSFIRPHADKINAFLKSKDVRFIAFQDLKPLVKAGSTNELLFLDATSVQSRVGEGYAGPTGEEANNKDKKRFLETYRTSSAPTLIFLGVDERQAPGPGSSKVDSVVSASDAQSSDVQETQGTAYFALDAGEGEWVVEGGEWGEARSSASAMTPWEAGLFAQARALIDWNGRNKFCPACGSRTYSLWAGWKRNCMTALEPPSDGRKPCFSLEGLHNFAYPRTDPVIIMGILNQAGDKILLGRQAKWPKGMYSCLAGFVEPGESFEDAVRREVMEEAGIEVGPVRYSSSQPWPYPANIMVGCFGRADDAQRIRLDLDNELEDARWFDRPTIASLVSSKSGTTYTQAEIQRMGKLSSADSTAIAKLLEQETANALAPSERKPGEGDAEGDKRGLTRVPPETAIAGRLIRLWASGGLDLVSRL